MTLQMAVQISGTVGSSGNGIAGQSAWADLTASADINRAYEVTVTFPGTSEPAETIVVAPLSATGDWRVWLMPTP